MASSNQAPVAASHHHRLVGGEHGSIEAFRGLVCGTIYGLVSPLIGQPLDTIKTKMQAQHGYERGSALQSLKTVIKNEGFFALYRGLLPPLIGSSIFRSVQFSAYAWAMGASKDSELMKTQIPGSGGLELRVLSSGLIASTTRAVIETPLEFIKVRRQTGQTWLIAKDVAGAVKQPLKEIAHLYKGFSVSWLRTWGLMGSFFVMVDSLERHYPHIFAIPVLGPFIKGGFCATAAWILVWPFENLKNQIQASTEGVPANASMMTRARYVVEHRGGFLGLYRGIGPGLARSLIANGSSMVVFNYCQQCFRTMGAA